jgi:uncharacterized protein
MIASTLLEEIIADQAENLKRKETGVSRHVDLSRMLKTNQISVISGIRRSGKSTLLYQLMQHYSDYYFINFDDERLISFEVEDFRVLMAIFLKSSEAKAIFIDEIQNVAGWERFVRRIHDEGYKIFITGSNAKLLSSELGTHLTGRYIKIELFPFSFSEYLSYLNIDHNNPGTPIKAKILKALDHYLVHGGFPDYIKYNDPEFLTRIYEDILYRDLIVRYGIKNSDGFRKLTQYLFTNFTSELSYNKLTEILGFKSVNSVKNFMQYLQECYLLFEMYKFDFSLKKQYVSNKKVYCIDNGLRQKISLRFSPDHGKLLENMVFVELKRRGDDVYFYRTKNNLEVDFYVPAIKQFIQVCHIIEDKTTYNREINAMQTAMKEQKNENNVILTFNEEDVIDTSFGKIRILPVWKWLLEQSQS